MNVFAGHGTAQCPHAIDIAQQVTAALAAVEKRGLVHRDLKPANLMLVSPDGETTGADRNNDKVFVK